VIEGSHNGFDIAEKDMLLRGPGDLFGTKQSGARGGMSTLCVEQLQRHPQLIGQARVAAADLLAERQLNPALKAALVAYGFWVPGDASDTNGSISGSPASSTGKSGVTGA
jgi:RecG-like helicase